MELQFSNLLLQWIGILILSSTVGGFLCGIILLVRLLFKIKKSNPQIIKYYILMILCILIAFVSWILNMGWCRLLLTWLAFPIIHSVIFAIINGKALLKLSYSSKLKNYTLISYATYVLSYILFPDGGDIGPMYAFFGLLHNNTIAYICGAFSVISFVTYIIFTNLQSTETNRIKQSL